MSLSDIIQEKGERLAFVGKHPALKYNLQIDFIDAYFQGLTLVALNDGKTIPQTRSKYLDKLQSALNLDATDTSMQIQQIAKLDDKAQSDRLEEVIPIIREHRNATALFFLEAATIIAQEKCNKGKDGSFCSHLAKILAIDEKSSVYSVSMNLISKGISFRTIAPLARVYSWETLAYFFPQVIKESEARNKDLLAKIRTSDVASCDELIQKEYPNLGREGILILLLPYLKEIFAQLKKVVQNGVGKCKGSRYHLNVEEYKEFNLFLSVIQILDRYWFKYPERFGMKIPSMISWTRVTEPEQKIKESYIAYLKTFLDELEFRLMPFEKQEKNHKIEKPNQVKSLGKKNHSSPAIPPKKRQRRQNTHFSILY